MLTVNTMKLIYKKKVWDKRKILYTSSLIFDGVLSWNKLQS